VQSVTPLRRDFTIPLSSAPRFLYFLRGSDLVMLGTAISQTKAAVPKPQDKLALREEELKQLLLLMDKDKNGIQGRLLLMSPEFSLRMKRNDLASSSGTGLHYGTTI
jgi:hypothetical protein